MSHPLPMELRDVWVAEVSNEMPPVWKDVVNRAGGRYTFVWVSLEQVPDLQGAGQGAIRDADGCVAYSPSERCWMVYLEVTAAVARDPTRRLVFHEFMHLFDSCHQQLSGTRTSDSVPFTHLWEANGRAYGSKVEAFAIWGSAYLDPDVIVPGNDIRQFFGALFGVPGG